ncbi:RodZ domain-containing protein [Teredinibacter sp. KSP-S5-2]|uniref:RodZ domain-containing protein n=1 Tax=Teredinibacter sp. KSP-S5-2 TaxID=3034506 RepID=UPI00293455D7|nr:RodZ domain-containing protein [Teredinibacter sp. KSP-S5-2]WNO07611.1 DUF4115 domain-containing protein [Teredinibacter sp. KSP-S5-2]
MTESDLSATQENYLIHGRPGAYLKQMREEKGISLQSIADDTLIPLKKLKDLEDDKYDDLGSSTYIVAYIRKYGRLVGIDTDEIVHAFEAGAAVSHEYSLDSSGAGLSQKDKDEFNRSPSAILPALGVVKKIPALGFVGLAVVAWILIAVFLSEEQPDTGTIESESLRSEVSMEQKTEETSAVAEPEAAVTEEEAFVVVPESEPDVEENFASPEEESQSTGFVETDVESVSDEQQDTSPIESMESGKDSLVLTFSEDSWVEIKDANGEQLIAQLKRKGDNLQLFGDAPFDVMMGNANGVYMTLNGEVVDTAPSGSRRTLRLKVGQP